MLKIAIFLCCAMSIGVALAQDAPQVDFLGLTCKNSPTGPEVSGIVKNVSSDRIDRMVVNYSFYSKNGEFISNGVAFPAFDPLLSEQQTPFDDFGENNPKIAYVGVMAGVFGAGALRQEGTLKAICR